MADNVLVVDRGVAAVRVLRALQKRGVRAVSVHTGADARSLHAQLADESVLLGEVLAAYGDVTKLLEAARQAGVQAVHPVTIDLPGLEAGVLELGLEWLGGHLQVPVELTVGDGVVEARCADDVSALPVVAPRSAEVVTGLDLTLASLEGSAEGVAREGVAVSVDVIAKELAKVTKLVKPTRADVWFDEAISEGTTPTQTLLAVLTAWGPDRDTAYALAGTAWDQLVIEGPDVPRPAALGGPHA